MDWDWVGLGLDWIGLDLRVGGGIEHLTVLIKTRTRKYAQEEAWFQTKIIVEFIQAESMH